MPNQQTNTPESETKPSSQTPTELEAAHQLLEAITQTLQAGRVPRGRKPLRDAIRLFRQLGLSADAFRAHCLLAELEHRQGELERALVAARAAQRLAEQHPEEPWLSASLELLARLTAATGQHEKAQEYALARVQRAQQQGPSTETVDALLARVQIAWQANDAETARRTAEEAVQAARQHGEAEALGRAELELGSALLRTGCPCAAVHLFTTALRGPITPDSRIRLLLSRGSASLCLGNYDSAARDFRRALRETKNHPDQRLEVRTTAALAAVEAARAHAESNAARLAKATKLADRATRRSRRLRDVHLERTADLAQETAARGEAALSETNGLPKNPQEAAGLLVALARGSQSELVVDACRREVEWLATLGQQARPYHCDFHAPFIPAP
jgi:tetratricopeptide (TPR) repeat protein